MSTKTMQAVRAHDYGGPDRLVIDTVPVPEPGPGQVRVRLLRAGVNPADWKFLAGMLKQFMPLTFPWTPGLEGAGIVDAVGEGVTAFRTGQAVFGTLNGGYAEYTATDASQLVSKPDSLTFDEAASASVGALTAWSAVEAADLQPGQRVLVQGGAGGVGLFAVQLAVAKGARVIATASAGNVNFVSGLGASEVIDYAAQAFEQAVGKVDAVIDTVGGEVLARSWDVLRPGGILVTTAGMIAPDDAATRGVRGQSAGRAPNSVLPQIKALLESGQLRAQAGRAFPLVEAAEAHRAGQSGHGRGRILLTIAA